MEIPGYFINLDRAQGRLAYMTGEIARLGLPVTRMAAVDGALLDDADMARLHPHALMHRLAKAEVACFLSHRKCWIGVADGVSPFGAVFEDDIAFSDDAAIFLNDDSWLPVEADLIKIETYSRTVMLDRKTRPAPGTRGLARLRSLHLGAGGYILSRAMAVQLVAETDTVSLPVDFGLFDPASALVPDAEVWQLTPAICVQQICSRAVFLPHGVEWSGLDQARLGLKKHGLAKLWREVTTPFVRPTRFLSRTLRALLTERRWVLIRFRK